MYDTDWNDHTYYISTQETGFELSMLQIFDVELLVGQLSYNQKATIYNITNGTKKERGTREKDGKEIEDDLDQVTSTSEAYR